MNDLQLSPASLPRGRCGLSLGAGLAALAVAAVFLVGGYLSWANAPLPVPAVPQAIPQPNGFEPVRAGILKIGGSSARSDRILRDADRKKLRRLLRPHREGLERLRQAVRLEMVHPPVCYGGFPLLLADDAARLFAAESRLALLEGNPRAAAERALDAMELGSRLGRGQDGAYHLFGLQCGEAGVEPLRAALPRLSPTEARAVGRRLDRILAQYPSRAERLRDERYRTLRLVRETLADPARFGRAHGWNPRIFSERSPELLYWKLRLRIAPKPAIYGRWDAYFERLLARAGGPPAERGAGSAPEPPDFPPRPLQGDDPSDTFARGMERLRQVRRELARAEAGAARLPRQWRAGEGASPPPAGGRGRRSLGPGAG